MQQNILTGSYDNSPRSEFVILLKYHSVIVPKYPNNAVPVLFIPREEMKCKGLARKKESDNIMNN